MRTLGVVVLLGCFAVATAASAQPAPAAERMRTDLGSGIYMISGSGAGNIGLLVGPDGAIMIDDQFEPLADQIAAEVAEITGDEAGAVRFIVNTHFHIDHAGGNAAWNARGATIVAHENVRTRLSTEQALPFGDATLPPSPEGAWPIITFTENVTFHINGQTVHVRHVDPAHTDDDAVVTFEEANVVHTGDVFINGGYPLVDIAAGGVLDGVIAAQELILEQIDEETRIIPGHGSVASKADLAASAAQLKDARDRLAALIEDGASEDDVVAAQPLADNEETLGGGLVSTELFIRMGYRSLTAGAED